MIGKTLGYYHINENRALIYSKPKGRGHEE